MTHFLTLNSIQRPAIMICIVLALLVLPSAGLLHCAVGHDADHPPAPPAGACCVFLCLTILLGLLTIPLKGLSPVQGALDLKPVRLANHLARWVPPPRPIGLLC